MTDDRRPRSPAANDTPSEAPVGNRPTALPDPSDLPEVYEIDLSEAETGEYEGTDLADRLLREAAGEPDGDEPDGASGEVVDDDPVEGETQLEAGNGPEPSAGVNSVPAVEDAGSDSGRGELHLVERSRTSLLQFLTLVVMVVLGVILFVAAGKGMGLQIPLLSLVALVACLYALVRERALREEQHQMTVQLIARERQMGRMHRRISEERERAEVLWDRLDEITSLYRAISAIKAAEDAAGALHTVVHEACALVGADCGSLQLLDETKSILTVEASDGAREVLLGETQGVDEGVAGWVLRNEEVLLLEGKAHEDVRFDHTFDQRGVPVNCSMAVPLTWHGEAFGVLNVSLADEGDKKSFTEHDQSLVRIFAEHAALVVVSTRELRRRTLGSRKLKP